MDFFFASDLIVYKSNLTAINFPFLRHSLTGSITNFSWSSTWFSYFWV